MGCPVRATYTAATIYDQEATAKGLKINNDGISLGSIRVLFDTQAFRMQRFGGISRYFVELIRRLPLFNVPPTLPMPLVDNEHAVAAGLSSKIGLGALSSHDWLRWLLYRLLAGSDSLVSNLGSYDVLHRTFYSAPKTVPRPSVCTVVDMIPELFPQYFPHGNPHFQKRQVVEASDLVLSISESTSRDIAQVYGYSPERVVTTPLGIDLAAFTDAPRLNHPFRSPYVLFVGNRDGYKNFRRFSVAAAAVLATHPELSLALVGGVSLREDEQEVFSTAGVLDRVKQATVSDATLPTVYREAQLFVFPSEYEGFGLPILESFACNCPLAASRASCFPEVGGDAAEYFDPKSVDDIGHAMERVLGSSTRADELRRLGRERVKSFSWERTAALTAAVYRRLC